MAPVWRVGMISVLLLLAAALRAQTAPDLEYVRVLERYHAGDDSAASALPPLVPGNAPQLQKSLLAVALVAHTDAALGLLGDADYARARQQLAVAESYAQRIQKSNRADPLVAQWWPVAIGFTHAQRNYVEATKVIERARRASGDTAELLLASGVTNELLAMAQAGRPSAGAPQLGTFQQAEAAFKSALAADPSFVEARLRLARVRSLRGDNSSAARMLAELQTPDDPLFSYLARLFEGDAFERQGAADEARRRYQAAIDLFPRAQSAQIALSYLNRSAGTRKEAAERIRTIISGDAGEGEDPWFWYCSGFASRIALTLPQLRKAVRQ